MTWEQQEYIQWGFHSIYLTTQSRPENGEWATQEPKVPFSEGKPPKSVVLDAASFFFFCCVCVQDL